MTDHRTAAQISADLYDAAQRGERKKVSAINQAQQQPVEAVRWKRDVHRGQWRDPEDNNTLRRAPKVVVGYRRVDPLVTMLARGTITKDHLAAGIRLRDDYEVGVLGSRPGSERSEVRSAAHSGGPAEHQLDALARYREALQALGQRLCGLLLHVVLDSGTVTDWAEKRGMSLSKATGYLEAGLDRLADHYGTSITADDLARAEI